MLEHWQFLHLDYLVLLQIVNIDAVFYIAEHVGKPSVFLYIHFQVRAGYRDVPHWL